MGQLKSHGCATRKKLVLLNELLPLFFQKTMVRQYCCCGSNLKAAKILAVLFTIGSVIGVGYYAYFTWRASQSDVRSTLSRAGVDPDLGRNILLGVTVYYALELLCEICLLVGAFKEKTVLMKIWLFTAVLTLIITLVGVILGQYSLIASFVLHLWAVLVVYGAIQELKEQ